MMLKPEISKLERYDMSYSALCTALHLEPTNDMLHYRLFLYYNERNERISAYRALENAINCDRTDTDYYFNIAAFICDELIARTESGSVDRISSQQKEIYVLPFILQAFLEDTSVIERAISFLKKNRLTSHIPALISVITNESTYEEAFSDVDMSIVFSCYEQDSKILSFVESLPDDFDKYTGGE